LTAVAAEIGAAASGYSGSVGKPRQIIGCFRISKMPARSTTTNFRQLHYPSQKNLTLHLTRFFSTGNPVKVRPKKLINKAEILFFATLFAPVAQMDRAVVS
jgi:hypothetical protein